MSFWPQFPALGGTRVCTNFRRAARFGACVALVCLLFIGSPVPFGYLAGVLLMIAAGRFAIVALHPAASALFRSLRPLPLQVALTSAFAAGCGVASALLAIKGDGLGWAFGVD